MLPEGQGQYDLEGNEQGTDEMERKPGARSHRLKTCDQCYCKGGGNPLEGWGQWSNVFYLHF